MEGGSERRKREEEELLVDNGQNSQWRKGFICRQELDE